MGAWPATSRTTSGHRHRRAAWSTDAGRRPARDGSGCCGRARSAPATMFLHGVSLDSGAGRPGAGGAAATTCRGCSSTCRASAAPTPCPDRSLSTTIGDALLAVLDDDRGGDHARGRSLDGRLPGSAPRRATPRPGPVTGHPERHVRDDPRPGERPAAGRARATPAPGRRTRACGSSPAAGAWCRAPSPPAPAPDSSDGAPAGWLRGRPRCPTRCCAPWRREAGHARSGTPRRPVAATTGGRRGATCGHRCWRASATATAWSRRTTRARCARCSRPLTRSCSAGRPTCPPWSGPMSGSPSWRRLWDTG